MIAIGIAANTFLETDPWKLAVYRIPMSILPFWMIAGLVFGVPLSNQHCPLCGELFHSRSMRWGMYYRNTFARKCLNCGLRLDAKNLEEAYNKQFNTDAGKAGTD